jgi:hypothetical protein
VALPPASVGALAVFNVPPDETRTVTGVPVGMLVVATLMNTVPARLNTT